MYADTSASQVARTFELLRAMTPRQREQAVKAAMLLPHRLAREAIAHEHPAIGEAELRLRVAVRLYGREAAARLGTVPEDAR